MTEREALEVALRRLRDLSEAHVRSNAILRTRRVLEEAGHGDRLAGILRMQADNIEQRHRIMGWSEEEQRAAHRVAAEIRAFAADDDEPLLKPV